jgi:hypothetical protein
MHVLTGSGTNALVEAGPSWAENAVPLYDNLPGNERYAIVLPGIDQSRFDFNGIAVKVMAI